MSNKLQVSENKSLKLSNVIIKKMEQSEFENFEKEVIQMESYIRSKGAMPMGPLIQYTNGYVNENGQLEVNINLMRQCSQFINHVEAPYKMEPQVNVKNCIYVRYTGDENKMKFAYDKLNLMAFEEDIPLKGDSYTVYVKQEEDTIVADVFMEKSSADF